MANESSVRVASELDAKLDTALKARGVVLRDSLTARVNFVLGDWLQIVGGPPPDPATATGPTPTGTDPA